jgi:hypothetical protein
VATISSPPPRVFEQWPPEAGPENKKPQNPINRLHGFLDKKSAGLADIARTALSLRYACMVLAISRATTTRKSS